MNAPFLENSLGVTTSIGLHDTKTRVSTQSTVVLNRGVRRSIFLPKEHGSWSLALEPIALGLVVVPSFAGGALAGAALAGFFCRRTVGPAFSPFASDRRVEARECLVMLSALVVTGIFEVLVLGESTAVWSLLLAVPFAGLFAYFDSKGESRAVGAEISGGITFALLPAVFALLAGWSVGSALGLALLANGRSVVAILTVRSYLGRRKNRSVHLWAVFATAVGALGVSGILGSWGLLPWAALVVPGVMLAQALWLLTPTRPAWSARQLGIAEAVTGVACTGLLVFAYSHWSPL